MHFCQNGGNWQTQCVHTSDTLTRPKSKQYDWESEEKSSIVTSLLDANRLHRCVNEMNEKCTLDKIQLNGFMSAKPV